MSVSRSGAHRAIRGALGLTAALAIGTGLLVAAPAVQARPLPTCTYPGAAPTNPTDDQITNVAAERARAADTVGRLSGQIADAQNKLTQLQGEVQLAEQKVALALQRQQRAEADAKKAKAKLKAAKERVRVAHVKFVQYIQAAYMDGRPQGMTGTLLSAEDPAALLDQSSYQEYEADHKLGAVGEMQRASVGVSNAEAKARAAQALSRKRTAEAKDAVAAAQVAYANQQRQNAILQNQMDDQQTQLAAAKAELSSLQGQRATYSRYAVKRNVYHGCLQSRIDIAAENRARAAERKRIADLRAAQARAGKKHRNGGGGSMWTPPRNSPAPPSGGSWSLSKAKRALARAKSTLGTPYAWAGGGAGGPSYGACVPSAGAPNDCNVYGYDCSGLVMYAWGKGWDHYAATQYNQAGSYHPSVGRLRVGDLLFYSNGGVAGIHHVALYAGGGRIIEAPYSGGVVRYASMYGPGPIFGATRPLT